MSAVSDTKDQHYISRAEQKLNAIDPAKPMWIYRFEVLDREGAQPLKAASRTGIRGSLQHRDLFSFDVLDDRYRLNFERRFQAYERDVARLSKALLTKLANSDPDLKAEVVDLFAAKLLNFVRNPHCVLKVLNTFGCATRYRPTDPQLSASLERLFEGNRPHQPVVCKRFGLTPTIYNRWLQTLFLLFAKDPRTPLDLFGSTVKGMFESSHVVMQVFHYTDADVRHVCLLSDRGFNQPLKDEKTAVGFEFNVCSRAFCRLVFLDPRSSAVRSVAPEVADTLRARVRVLRVVNDLQELARYNQRTAYQCAERVYGASPTPLV